MGKKKFIDKRNAATFHLLARDSSVPGQSNGPDSDHVFVRVDNNPIIVGGFDGSDNNDSEDDPDFIFADAPEDGHTFGTSPARKSVGQSAPLPDHIRREILELGFPDDGYNYLTHLREIKNAGGGSNYYQNPKPNLDQIPLDVKAYDASKVRVKCDNVEANEKKIMYTVAEKTTNVRVQKAVDPEVIALLDDNNSQFGSDVEDLEEDFIVQANLPDGAETFSEASCILADDSQEHTVDGLDQARDSPNEAKDDRTSEKPRVRRLLDEQFDMLEQQEYGIGSDDDYDDFVGEEEEPLAKKLDGCVLLGPKVDDLDLLDKYKAPADLARGDSKQHKELSNFAAEVLRQCAEYAEKYENAKDDDTEVVVLEESSDESEAWDCETIVSTYSNLDNHPGRIEVPGFSRRKKLSETISGTLESNDRSNIISLRGKDRFPVGYLPNGKSATKEKVKPAVKQELPKTRQHGQESKEEKKERKAAVKEEKREARRLKKETKELYRGEAKQAQKVASSSGPSSIRLM